MDLLLIWLVVAILFEVAATMLLKPSNGGHLPWRITLIVLFYGISFYLLSIVMKYLPMGVVYATWSGVGTLLIALLGIWIYKEQVSVKKIMGLMLTIIGLVLINL